VFFSDNPVICEDHIASVAGDLNTNTHNWWDNGCTWGATSSSATLYTTNPTRTGMGPNAKVRVQIPATNCLSPGKARTDIM
jgi:hypothetical protein